MKKIFFIFLILLTEAGLAQTTESCKCDSLLNFSIQTMYDNLNELDPALNDFIQTFIRDKRGKASLGKIPGMIRAIENSIEEINKFFPDSVKIQSATMIPKRITKPCFICSVNKEIRDYVTALSILEEELNDPNLLKNGISSFQYAQVISVYHYIITARSALMAMMDSTQRNCAAIDKMNSIQKSIDVNTARLEKKVKRWSLATVVLTGVVAVLVATQ